jgi:hypothetical protein
MPDGCIHGHDQIKALQQRHCVAVVANLGTDIDQRRGRAVGSYVLTMVIADETNAEAGAK